MTDVSAAPQAPMLHDCVIERKKNAARACVMPVPPEEFGISRYCRSMRDATYAYHRPQITEAELIAQGYDENQVKNIPAAVHVTQIEEIDRDTVAESQYAGWGGSTNTSARRVDIIEHYCRFDYERNGEAKLYKITTGGVGGEILRKTFTDRDGKTTKREDIEEMSIMPFAAMTPIIVTHRFFGKSIADLVMEIQRIKTALVRGALDNTYLRNNPRPEVAEQFATGQTLDDLMVARLGAPIRVRQPGGINWQETPDVSATTLPMLEYMDQTREMRTGVTRQGQGIDAQALSNQTATAVAQTYSMAQARMRLIARIFAETGIKDLFTLLHATIRQHGQEAQTVRLRKKWVAVDPRNWKTRDDLTVHVGLGHGNQAQEIANATMIGSIQEKMLVGGMVDVVQKRNVYNAAKLLCRALKIKNVDEYFTDPDSPEAQQIAAQAAQNQKPDPKVQIEQMKIAGDQQKAQLQFQLDEKKAVVDAQHQAAKNTAEAALAEKKFQLDRELKIIDAELRILESERQHQYKVSELGMKAQYDQQSHDAKAADIGARQAETTTTHSAIKTLGEHVAGIHEQNAALLKSLATPKKRVAVRDKAGKLVAVTEEPAA